MWYAASGTSEVPDQVEVVLLKMEDILRGLAKEASALHRRWLYQSRSHDGNET